MADEWVTFSIRLTPPAAYYTLGRLAGHARVSKAALAREFVLDGMRKALDPAEIERLSKARLQHLLTAVAEIRQLGEQLNGS
jgi:hypothetical protein